jgi:hypothetical protein
LQIVVLSFRHCVAVLRFTYSDYPVYIFKLFLIHIIVILYNLLISRKTYYNFYVQWKHIILYLKRSHINWIVLYCLVNVKWVWDLSGKAINVCLLRTCLDFFPQFWQFRKNTLDIEYANYQMFIKICLHVNDNSCNLNRKLMKLHLQTTDLKFFYYKQHMFPILCSHLNIREYCRNFLYYSF